MHLVTDPFKCVSCSLHGVLICISLLFFKWVACVDVAANEEANANVLVKLTDSFPEQAEQVLQPFHVSKLDC